MKVSELSEASGLPVATIKYYLRENLLPPGVRTATNQAVYDEGHLHRLRLIVALLKVGELSVNTVRDVLAAVDDEDKPLHDVLGVAHHALALRGARAEASPRLEEALADIDRFIAQLGWNVAPGAPAKRQLAGALVTLRQLGWAVDGGVFSHYAKAAHRLAAWELQQIPPGASRLQAAEGAVVGTVVFETALVALRRLAQEHYSGATWSRRRMGT
ncbi:MAG: MerR family transcriptional regulator [Actinomycetota bacterium]